MTAGRLLATAFAGAIVTASAHAAPVTLHFSNVSGNSAVNAAIGESQFRVTISEVGSNVNFRFFHDGSAASSIARIYFDDRAGRLGSATLAGSGSGVAFTTSASPPNLPAGNELSPAFSATKKFGAMSPPPQKGINPGEFLDITFSLTSGDFDDLLTDIAERTLRFGFHAIAFAAGGSETFVNEEPIRTPVVPLPTPLALAGAGLLGLAAIRRRR